MVIFGGLELVAAGYLIHKHNQTKRERALLREEAEALEEQQYPLQDSRPHRHHRTHSLDREESREERHERHRRRRSRERREREKWEAEHAGWQGRPTAGNGNGRDHNSAPSPNMIPVPQHAATFPAKPQQPQQGGFPPTGWPAHWKQSQTPPTPPLPQQQQQMYPQDVKYGFVPDIPHDQYPPYPPPPFSPGLGPTRDSRGRANTLDVNDARGRRRGRRTESLSPNLGVRDEYSRSPVPRVRFSNEDVVLGESSASGRPVRSPPPSYRS